MYVDYHTKRQGYKMKVFSMFITAVCVLFLIKLRWPKTKSLIFTFLTNGTRQWLIISVEDFC